MEWYDYFLMAIPISFGLIYLWIAFFTKAGRLYMHHRAMCGPWHCDCEEYAKKLWGEK